MPNMKSLFFTPGPSQLYPNLDRYLMEGYKKGVYSLSHRSQKCMKIIQSTKEGLAVLLGIPKTHAIFFLGSSLESMERIMENMQGTHSFHFVSGSFGEAFVNAAKATKKKTTIYRIGANDDIDVTQLVIPKQTNLICITQNETSNGSSIEPKTIHAIKKKYPTMQLAVDIVSSAPYPNLDFHHIDYAFFSVQKGFGLPSGLSVLIVNRSAIIEKSPLGFHSLVSLAKKEKINQTPETPNVLAIYLLGRVVAAMNRKGIATIRREIELKAKMIETLVTQHSAKLSFAVSNTKTRSKTVIVLNIADGSKLLLKKLSRFGITVGNGYGSAKDRQIRTANFPQHLIGDMDRLINTMKEVL